MVEKTYFRAIFRRESLSRPVRPLLQQKNKIHVICAACCPCCKRFEIVATIFSSVVSLHE